jgi:hypothetical protein
MRSPLRERGVLPAALALYLAALAGLVAVSVRLGGGTFTYPLDDTYIHLALAKHFAQGQAWGLTPGEFASCSSSPLWTLLLAAFSGRPATPPSLDAVFGASPPAPLLLAALFGIVAMVVAHRVLRPRIANPTILFLVLVTAMASTPLPTLGMSGLEHALHACLVLVFVGTCGSVLSRDAAERRERWGLLLLAALLGSVRYESLMLVFCACLLFAWRRAWGFAVALGLAAIAPVVAYGLWSMSHGWFFLPNSILLKVNVAVPSGGLPQESALAALARSPHLLGLMLAAGFLLFTSLRAGRRWSAGQVAVGLFLATAILHLLFARVGWLFRYEAYLVFLGVVVVALAAGESSDRLWPRGAPAAWRWTRTAALLALIAPLGLRAGDALGRTPQASKNIHDQQIQMGEFVALYYRGHGVAANDVGAVSYLGDVRMLDLFGLADLEVARRKMRGAYRTEDIRELARERDVSVAVVYDSWFEPLGGVPAEWVRAGEWTITRNVVCGDDRVTWYAVEPGEAERLIGNLKEFARRLPPDVGGSGAYVQR